MNRMRQQQGYIENPKRRGAKLLVGSSVMAAVLAACVSVSVAVDKIFPGLIDNTGERADTAQHKKINRGSNKRFDNNRLNALVAGAILNARRAALDPNNYPEKQPEPSDVDSDVEFDFEARRQMLFDLLDELGMIGCYGEINILCSTCCMDQCLVINTMNFMDFVHIVVNKNDGTFGVSVDGVAHEADRKYIFNDLDFGDVSNLLFEADLIANEFSDAIRPGEDGEVDQGEYFFVLEKYKVAMNELRDNYGGRLE